MGWWVLHNLTAAQKHTSKCMFYCDASSGGKDPFLDRVLIYEENWVSTTLHGIIIIGWHHNNLLPNNEHLHCINEDYAVFSGMFAASCIANCCKVVRKWMQFCTRSNCNGWMKIRKPSNQRMRIKSGVIFAWQREDPFLRSSVTSLFDLISKSCILHIPLALHLRINICFIRSTTICDNSGSVFSASWYMHWTSFVYISLSFTTVVGIVCPGV